GWTNILHQLAIDLRLDFCLEVRPELGLHVASHLQRYAGSLGHVDREVRTLDGSDASNEAQVVLFPCLELVLRQINAMVDHTGPRHRLSRTLRLADAHVIDIGIAMVELRQTRLVRTMQGEH